MPVVFVVDGMDLRDTVAESCLCVVALWRWCRGDDEVGVVSFAFAFVQAVSTCGIEALSKYCYTRAAALW